MAVCCVSKWYLPHLGHRLAGWDPNWEGPHAETWSNSKWPRFHTKLNPRHCGFHTFCCAVTNIYVLSVEVDLMNMVVDNQVDKVVQRLEQPNGAKDKVK